MNKFLNEIQGNTIKEENVFKEASKSLKQIQENIIKQVKEMNKIDQDLKMEIEAIKKTQLKEFQKQKLQRSEQELQSQVKWKFLVSLETQLCHVMFF